MEAPVINQPVLMEQNPALTMPPELVNQNLAGIEAATIQHENMMALLSLAMFVRSSNPNLANTITGVAVVNRHAEDINTALFAQQLEQRRVAEELFHRNKKEEEKEAA